jgi:hypothetical protein
MTHPRLEPELSLMEFLSSRARHASDARLALDAAGGFIVALSATVWHGPGWRLIALAAICFLAYGVWGIVDRELHERPTASGRMRLVLEVARGSAIVVGISAAVALVLVGMAVGLGTIIS